MSIKEKALNTVAGMIERDANAVLLQWPPCFSWFTHQVERPQAKRYREALEAKEEKEQ